jgi:DNA primase
VARGRRVVPLSPKFVPGGLGLHSPLSPTPGSEYPRCQVIAQETIDKIRDLANIGDIIGESVRLERKGRSLTGLCPFHKEKSPSFNVNEERGFYHCFGCKASGDVFKFVQETEGLSFLEAVRALGERLGVDIEDDLSSDERKRRDAEKRQEQALFDVNASAAQFFEDMLRQHAGVAHQELARRGLSYSGPAHGVLKSFRVGYAPDTWDALASFLKRAGHDLRAAESVGLIAPRKQGQGYYDRFRHRLMFAVLDLHGRVVAFSGRSLPPLKPLEEDPPAKYINSPESPIYKKRSSVFGLYQARSALRAKNQCVIVEGNFDVVSLHAQGFAQTVAPLGTAFTLEQGKLIRRFASEVILLFDADQAGRKAAVASREPAKEAGLSAKVARLPDGSDPDDFARAKGAEGLKNLIDASQGMLDYMISLVLDEKFAAADAEGQARRIQKVVELLKAEDDPNVAALAERHADRLAGRLGLADGHTFRALKNSIRRSLQAERHAPWDEGASAPRPDPVAERTQGIGKAIVGALLDFPELLDSDELIAYSAHMEGDAAAAVATLKLLALQKGGVLSGGALQEALPRLPDRLQPFAAQRLAAPKHLDIDTARVELFANLDKLHQMELTRLSSSALSEIERARQEGDYDQELELLRRQEERARRRRGL